jgi:hypothetical protein
MIVAACQADEFHVTAFEKSLVGTRLTTRDAEAGPKRSSDAKQGQHGEHQNRYLEAAGAQGSHNEAAEGRQSRRKTHDQSTAITIRHASGHENEQ